MQKKKAIFLKNDINKNSVNVVRFSLKSESIVPDEKFLESKGWYSKPAHFTSSL